MSDILRIDLTTGAVRTEPLSPELVRDYIGTKGIGSHLLLEEVGPEVDPLSPQNKLFFSCGPLSGSTMPGTNRYAVYFLSPLTGGYGEAYSGGKLATQFARTGHRLVILEGRSATPVYIEVNDEGAVIHPADDLWGLDTYEAEEHILRKTGLKAASACVIGPAGERLVRFACIQHERTHSLGRGGPGAVMGSKNVKGLVFHGSKKPEFARPDELKELVREMVERGKDNPGVNAYNRMGTVQMVRTTNGVSMFPNRYWTKGYMENFELVSAETMIEKYKVANTTCPPCMIQCGNLCRVPEGEELAGLEIDGPEFETIFAFAGLCEVVDFAQVMRMNDICDRGGMDTITAGNLCGLMIEASRRGLIDMKLDFGDAEGVAELLRLITEREGLGDLLAEGVLTVEKKLGLEGVAVHVKGMEPPAYDPRSSKGMGLGYITSSRGACHMRATFMKAELAGLIDLQATEGKGAMFVDWENRLVIMDSMVFCRFYRDLVDWEFITRIVNAAVGTDYTPDELGTIANRIVTETHRFNELRGFGPEKERLPAWVTERPITSADGRELRITTDELEYMRRDYYEARGWGAPAV